MWKFVVFFLQKTRRTNSLFSCIVYIFIIFKVSPGRHCARLSMLLPLFCDISQKCQTICSKHGRTSFVLTSKCDSDEGTISMAPNTETCSVHVINMLLHVHKTNLFIPIKWQILWAQKSAGQTISNTTGYSISSSKLSNCQKVTLQSVFRKPRTISPGEHKINCSSLSSFAPLQAL